MATQCEFVKKSGERCGAYAIENSKLCYWHCPEALVSRRQAQKRGGVNRLAERHGEARTYSIKTPGDIMQALESALNDVGTLENSHSKARSIGYLCQIALKGLEIGQLEERVATLEGKLNKGGSK